MISLILPYWDRQAISDEAFALLSKHYSNLEIEVIVVDDGNKIPFQVPDTPLRVRVVRLSEKSEPTSPLHAWNVGVKEARGDIIALSCIEILHENPVLDQMAAQLDELGRDGYVLASAWCPELKDWHCHSSIRVPTCPEGTGIGFLSMMRKTLFNRVGGFDEDFMGGAGYEDRDFIRTLHAKGAKFCIRDDLVVTHPKRGASIKWKPEALIKNEKLYYDKWKPKPVTFLCLKAGNAYGPEYVNILYDMVKRNMRSRFRFVCLTDDPSELVDGIDAIPLPSDIETWWGKLYMFKRGLFDDGERVIFLDLDTVIVGDLDRLVEYSGQFATLRDFYFQDRLGPAIISWKAGDFASSIWEEWDSNGRPREQGGDLWWLNNLDQGRFAASIDLLQDLMPGYFCSFKVSCNPYPPPGTHIVCFHGQPKPDNCNTEWVAETWKVGGLNLADLEVVCNTEHETVSNNIKSSCERDLPWLAMNSAREGKIAIVGGGPSLPDYLDELHDKHVVAVNGAHEYLIERGIIPDFHLIIDARPENAEFIKTPAKSYWLSSQCDSSVFDKAKNVTLIHMNTLGVLDSIPPTMKPINLISSGSTVGLAGMAIAYCLGWRDIYVYGMDSSYEKNRHAYTQTLNENDRAIEATAGGKDFTCAPWMVAQVQHFQTLTNELTEAGCDIHVRCDGLLGHVAWLMMLQKNADNSLRSTTEQHRQELVA